MTNNEENKYVPEEPPYGSITDLDYCCGRCGNQLTGCSLCAGLKIHVIRIK